MKKILLLLIAISALFSVEVNEANLVDAIKKCDEKDKIACGEVSRFYGKITKKSRFLDAESMKLWVEYAIKGCELKDGESCYTIGYHYAGKESRAGKPRVFEVDYDKAMEYFLKACDYGFGQSCYLLGLINYDNFYKKQGDKNEFKLKSKQFIKKACDLEYEKACGENWDLP